MLERRGPTGTAAALAAVALGALLAGCAGTQSGGASGSPSGGGSPATSTAPTSTGSATAVPTGDSPGSSTAAPTDGTSSDPTGSAVPTVSGSSGPPPALVVSYEGGLAPPQRQFDIPDLSLWDDGRIVQPGAQIAIYPPPALPALTLAQVDPAAMPGVLDTVATGLDGLPDDFGMPPTADVPSTRVVWRHDGHESTWTAASLGVGDDEPSEQVSEEQIRHREQLARVVEYAEAVAAGSVQNAPVSQQGAYLPDAWYVWSTPYQQPLDGDEPPPARPWPGPAPLTGGPDPGQWACQVVVGADAAEVTAAMSDAVSTTPWRSAGQKWMVVVRPLLPGDPTACPQES